MLKGAGKRLRPRFQLHLASPSPRDPGKAAPPPPASVSRFDGAGGGPGRPPHPARRNLAARPAGPGEGPLERAQRAAGFWRGGHLGWGPPPASTRLHPLAPPGGSGDALNRKKLSPWPEASVPAPSPPPRRSQGKQLLTSPCVLPALPASRPPGSPARPGEARSRPAARPSSPRSSSSPRLAAASSRLPPSVAFAGHGPGSWLGSFPDGGSFWAPRSPASISWPLLGPARACCPFPASFLCSSPSQPSLSSPEAPGLLPALGAGTIAPARARPPGPVAPDARARRGCWRPGP